MRKKSKLVLKKTSIHDTCIINLQNINDLYKEHAYNKKLDMEKNVKKTTTMFESLLY